MPVAGLLPGARDGSPGPGVLRARDQLAVPRHANRLHREALVAVLAVSLRKFGLHHLAEALTKLRVVLGHLLEEGVLGAILIAFLIASVDSLGRAPCCRPLLRRFAKTGRHKGVPYDAAR